MLVRVNYLRSGRSDGIESELLDVKFYRVSHPTSGSGLVVRYRELNDNGLEISASWDGVMLNGASGAIRDVEVVKQVLDRALEWHQLMRERYIYTDDYISPRRLNCTEVDKTPLAQEPDCVVEAHVAMSAGEDKIVERR